MCGILALFCKNNEKNIYNQTIEHLQLLQHRGEDGYGIAFSNNIFFRESGTVKHDKNFINIQANASIAQTRYSTSGKSMIQLQNLEVEQQPLIGVVNKEPYYLVHNGNIPGVKEHDTKFIVDSINSLTHLPFEERLIYFINNVSASYAIIILYKNNLYAMRDCYGVRPMCIGINDDTYCISSESYGLGKLHFLKDIQPGEIIKIDKSGLKHIYLNNSKPHSLCTFEILYFANENSIIDGYHIKNIRKNLAITLAKKDKDNLKDCIVIGIPKTGILLGKEYAKYLNLDYRQWINKNPDVDRTFILKNDEERIKACNKKFIYDKNFLKNKNVILIDDTIVRGSVITSVISNLKNIGVKNIHVRIPAPPVIDICVFGIAIQDKKELIMNKRTTIEVCNKIGATTLKYLELDDICKLLPRNTYNHCFSKYFDYNMFVNKLKDSQYKIKTISSISNDFHTQGKLQMLS